MLNVDVMAMAHLTSCSWDWDMVKTQARVLFWSPRTPHISPRRPMPAIRRPKSFVLNYGEALNYELRNTNVGVTVVALGIVDTAFHDVAGQKRTATSG